MDRSFHATDYLTFPPSIDARVPITFGLLLRHVVPVHLAYYLTAVLVCTPNTRCYRMLLLPITLALAWVAATAFDMSGGDPQYKHLNYANDVRSMLYMPFYPSNSLVCSGCPIRAGHAPPRLDVRLGTPPTVASAG
jgi:hypothetical protein